MSKNEEINNELKLIINYIKDNDIVNAEILTNKCLQKFPESYILHDLKGSIFLKQDNFEKSVEHYSIALKYNPDFTSSLLNLGVAYQKLNNDDEALNCFQQALRINSNLFNAYNNIGFIFNRQGRHNDAIQEFNKSIKINPKFAESYLNLGLSYQKLKDYEKAIIQYENALRIKPTLFDAYFNLGEIYKKLDQPKKAYENYLKSKNRNTNKRILECLFLLNLKKEYQEQLDILSKKFPDDRSIASISAYIANQFKIADEFPFCPNPLNFVFKTNIKKKVPNFNDFLNDLLKELSELFYAYEPYARTTIKGHVTKGNLSSLDLPFVLKLEKYFSEQIQKYKENFINENCNFIKNWPKKYNFYSWSNKLKKEGYNIPHIHPSGWLSGVFYLAIPSKISGDEAGIEFSLHGDDFKKINTDIPHKIIKPEIGDLVLFPSSLYHRTIPFDSNEERICIAFDITKN